MINQNTPPEVAAALMRKQFKGRAEAIILLRRDLAKERGQDRRADMWERVLTAFIGGRSEAASTDDGWQEITPAQYGLPNVAASYATALGWEWEVFGKSRGNHAATLAEAKAAVAALLG